MAKSLSLQDQLNMKTQAKLALLEVRRHVELALAVLSPWGGRPHHAIAQIREAKRELSAADKTVNTLWRKTSYADKAKTKARETSYLAGRAPGGRGE